MVKRKADDGSAIGSELEDYDRGRGPWGALLTILCVNTCVKGVFT